MAKISLLFSLAFALALGSLFLSVSSHTPPVPPRKSLCPKTISELQTLPFTEITQILNQKERLAPKTTKIKAMFTMCKAYVAYLESLYKFENPIVDVLGIAKTKYALTNKAILAVRASVSSKVDKKTSLKLRKSCAGFTKGFLQIQKEIVKISAKHNYKADAKINLREWKNIGDAMKNFKNSIDGFMDVVNDLEKKKMKNFGHHARSLEDYRDGARVYNAFERFLRRFSDKHGGYLGGKTHGRELTEAELNAHSHGGADFKGFETIYEQFSHFFGGYPGGSNPHGRELTEAQAGVHAGAQADGKVNNRFDEFSQYIPFFGSKAHGRKLLKAQAEVNAEAQAGENFKRSFEDFLNYNGGGLGGKVQMDATGKMKVTGKDGFRSLNREHYKHFVSKEA